MSENIKRCLASANLPFPEVGEEPMCSINKKRCIVAGSNEETKIEALAEKDSLYMKILLEATQNNFAERKKNLDEIRNGQSEENSFFVAVKPSRRNALILHNDLTDAINGLPWG